MRLGETVRAAVIDAPNADPRVVQFSPPTLTSRSALLSTLYSEVCGTDVHIWRGKVPGVPPSRSFPGMCPSVSSARSGQRQPARHRWAAIQAKAISSPFLDVHETCNHCYYCLVAKQTTRCPHRRVYGITYSADDGLLGGWSEVIWLKPGLKLVRIPEVLNSIRRRSSVVDAGLVTAIHAIDRAEIKLGQDGGGPRRRSGRAVDHCARRAVGRGTGDR